MSTPANNARGVRVGEVGIADAGTTARAKRLLLEAQDERTRGRIAYQMRGATGLTQRAYGEEIGASEHIVQHHEQGTKSPNLSHLLDAPDEAFDAGLRELLLERKRRGFAARLLIAAPEVVHTCEHQRTSALVIELSDVMRARAAGAEPRVVAKEAGEAIESLTELIAASTLEG